MNWQTRFQTNPQLSQAVRLATGRPAWVLKATGAVALVVFLLPLIALAVLMFAALFVTALAWVLFSTIARILDTITGRSTPTTPNPATPDNDGRDNVRVIQRL